MDSHAAVGLEGLIIVMVLTMDLNQKPENGTLTKMKVDLFLAFISSFSENEPAKKSKSAPTTPVNKKRMLDDDEDETPKIGKKNPPTKKPVVEEPESEEEEDEDFDEEVDEDEEESDDGSIYLFVLLKSPLRALPEDCS